MPAVIDTGGPRVLHCVERAEYPIPKAQSVLSVSRSSCRSYPIGKQQPRLDIDAVHRCTDNVAALLGSSIDETGNIPGNDERDGFFNDGRSSAPVSPTSSNDLGPFIARAERGRRFRDRKHYDVVQRRQINRRKRIRHGVHSSGQAVQSSPNCQYIPEISDILLRDEPTSAIFHNGENLRQRMSTNRNAKDPHGSSGTSAGHLTHALPYSDPDGIEQSPDIVTRLFGGCDLERERKTMYGRIEKASVAISSQRVLSCAEYEWRRCECECLSSISSKEFVSMKNESESERSTRERRNMHRPRNQHKGRSYVQLALLLFLVAFGHGSLFKSNFASFGSLSAGLSFMTIGTIVGSVRAVPVDLDAGVRAERSANLSHITGASRKIQMYIKNRHLQILRDGTVNGSNDDTSDYTIFQRTSVSRGQLWIQGVATCLYLCMDSCGLLYGSREYTEDCVFNENLEQHNYNTYSSVRWSTPKKSLYLGLNRRGQPRRVQAKGHNLGRLSAYARVLTQVAPPERVEALQARMLGAEHSLRHHHNSRHHRNMQNHNHQHHQEQQQSQQQAICPTLPPQEKDGRDKFHCRKRKKRKKWKRRCNDGEKPGPHCGIVESHGRATTNTSVAKSQSAGESGPPQSKRSCEGEASEELCRKQALDAPAKKRKSRIEGGMKGTRMEANKQQSSKRKKETRMKKENETSNAEGGVNGKVKESDSAQQRINGSNGNRKKRPGGGPQQRTSSAATRKKVIGRPTRTTITDSPTGGSTLPSSWYPNVSPTPSTEVSSAERRTKSTAYSVRNSVTSSTWSKEAWGERHERNFRKGKSLEEDGPVLPKENSGHETSTEQSTEDHSAGVSALSSDWSMETSDEVKSDESSIQQEDETTASFGEYSTLMTTMDTTPPERTEDYIRATTESLIGSAEIVAADLSQEIQDSGALGRPQPFGDRTKPFYERFAM